MSKYIRVAFVAATLFATCAATAAANPPSGTNPAGKMLGVVPAHGQASKLRSSGGNLSYHNGPVMHTNTVYAIYWIPSGGYTGEPAGGAVSTNYESVINGYFGNVAAASGTTTNVYNSDTQYYDSLYGHILYSSSYANSYVDTNPFPASGCTDSYTTICLTDSQIQAEIQKVITASGLSSGLNNSGSSYEFFMLTPKNVGSCSGSSCAFSSYCAYHSWIGSGTSAILYANMPYAAWVPSACGSGQSPNRDDADSTINVISHEHNETITDPLGSAWYDQRGYEDGDKCAWNFGTSSQISGSPGAEYNQTINGAHYYLQQEWSNHSSGCVLTGL